MESGEGRSVTGGWSQERTTVGWSQERTTSGWSQERAGQQQVGGVRRQGVESEDRCVESGDRWVESGEDNRWVESGVDRSVVGGCQSLLMQSVSQY